VFGVDYPYDANGCPLPCECAPVDREAGPIIYDEGGPPIYDASPDVPDVGPSYHPEAGPGIGACPLGPLNFELRVAAGSTAQYCADFEDPTTHATWLSIEDADGGMAVGPTTFDPLAWGANCSPCEALSEPPFENSVDIFDGAPVQLTWNAVYGTVSSCVPANGSASITCSAPVCLPAGSYVAKMCGASSCPMQPGTSWSQTCVFVPFEYPTSAPIVGTLP
jgi:hypothetical protein